MVCIPLGPMACFDFEPIRYLDENLSPDFEHLAFEDGTQLTVDDANVRVFAIAYDEDYVSGDTLDFLWYAGPQFISGDPMQVPGDTSDERVLFASQIVVPYDLDLNGQELSCTVIDPEGAKVEASWPLVVL